MRIKHFKYEGILKGEFKFNGIDLRNTNLFVGASSSGKTKLLNAIFNVGNFVSNAKKRGTGKWIAKIEGNKKYYIWEFVQEGKSREDNQITLERITLTKNDSKQVELVLRENNSFYFKI